MTKDGLWALALIAPVVLGGGFSLVRLATEGFDVPAEGDYVAIREALEGSDFDPAEDRLAILPPWSLRPLKELKAFPWITGDGLAERPLHRVDELFLVVENDGEQELAALEERFGEAEELARSGPVGLYRLSTGGRTVVDDLAGHLKRAEVRLVKGDDVTPCDKRRRNGWGCKGRKNWQRVTRQRLLVTENSDVALWAHPPPRGERLELTWPEAALGELLVVRAGFTRKGSNWAKAPVRVRISVDGQEVARFDREPRFDFAAERIDTSRWAGDRAPVTFTIDTRDNGKSHFAFDAYTASSTKKRGGGRP